MCTFCGDAEIGKKRNLQHVGALVNSIYCKYHSKRHDVELSCVLNPCIDNKENEHVVWWLVGGCGLCLPFPCG